MSEVKRYSVWDDELFDEKHAINARNGMVHLVVKFDDYAELQDKCAALAAENAALKQSEKEFNNFCRQEYYGWEDNFTETPATDAFLAEVRAQGVEMLTADRKSEWMDSYIDDANEFAEQLRKGGNQ